ncbi:MAG: hypothetical protein K0M69_15890 [Youngiibacter sp.]|nr:hypothetical protein [Youngiibacter sp.]
MVYIRVELILEDEPGLDSVLKTIEAIEGVNSVEIEEDTYHEYNVDSDPFWEEEE